MPDAGSLRLAAEWLDAYDSETPEVFNISQVAEWLRQKADEQDDREIAQLSGKPVAVIRKMMDRHSSGSSVPTDVLREQLLFSLRYPGANKGAQ